MTTSHKADDFLQPLAGPELFIGIVAPIGTDVKLVSRKLSEELKLVDYTAVEIHITDLLAELKCFDIAQAPLEARYDSLIKAGNNFREKIGRSDAMAFLSLAKIRKARTEHSGDRDRRAPRVAYILNQFKRPEEIEALRTIYGRSFIQVSAYCSKDKRVEDFTKRISESHNHEKSSDHYRAEAFRLIARDDIEEEAKFGQRVRDTFPLADVIVDAESEQSAQKTCARFIRAFFGDHFISPSIDEYGTLLAKAAALRSADLSRQVGAAILSDDGEVITMGCNEVPKAGGGAYWESDPNDARDFQLGYDSGARWKINVFRDALRRLKQDGYLNKELDSLEVNQIAENLLNSEIPKATADSQILDILEYGRSVHAEMMAISDAARLGVSLKGASLFTTTFPCHMCARHIIAAGIKRVVYIEPYSKSIAGDLYPEAINMGRDTTTTDKVNFEPFVGIAPERYPAIFAKRGKRKNSAGQAMRWNPKNSEPIINIHKPMYIELEKGVLAALNKRMQDSGLNTPA